MWTLRTLHRKQEQQNPAGGEPPASVVPVTPVVAPVTSVVPVVEPVAPAAPVKLNYDSPAAKQVADMLVDAGIDPSAAAQAIKANGGTITPDIYAALVTKHGEGMASVLSNQMAALTKVSVTKSAEADQAIYLQCADAFKGITEQTGEETFNELKTWAATNIEDADRNELNKCIQAGGMPAKLAMQELINMFQQSGDYSQDMVGVNGDRAPAAPQGGDITRAEYNTQLDALIAKGHVYGHSNEIAALDARRTRSASRGY